MNAKKFNCFLSYSTDPDYKLVCKVERFLESFHKNFSEKERQELGVMPIKACVDESDFNAAMPTETDESIDPISDAIRSNLRDSDWLVVFCSKKAMTSKWVDDEIEYWVENFGADRIRLILTDSDANPDELFSETILHSKINAKPWIDLRGFSKRKSTDRKVRDSDEQLVQLAAQLQRPPQTKGDLWPAWKRESDRRKRRKFVMLASLAVLFFLSIAGGLGGRHWFLRGRAVEILGTFNATFSNQSAELRINYPPKKTKDEWRIFENSVERLSSLSVFRVCDCQFENLSFLLAHKQLKELGLNHCFKVKDFAALSKLKSLTFLDLSETEISDSDASKIDWPAHLKEISLCRCRNLTSVGVNTILKSCKEITTLKLSARNVTPRVLSQLNSFPIQKITIDGTLKQDLLLTFEHRSKVQFIGVDKPSGPLL